MNRQNKTDRKGASLTDRWVIRQNFKPNFLKHLAK